MTKPRPTIINMDKVLRYSRGSQATITMPFGRHKRGLFSKVEVVLMDLGFSTHGVHMDQRMVTLPAVLIGRRLVTFAGPPNANGEFISRVFNVVIHGFGSLSSWPRLALCGCRWRAVCCAKGYGWRWTQPTCRPRCH
jgi:hypothetical protein